MSVDSLFAEISAKNGDDVKLAKASLVISSLLSEYSNADKRKILGMVGVNLGLKVIPINLSVGGGAYPYSKSVVGAGSGENPIQSKKDHKPSSKVPPPNPVKQLPEFKAMVAKRDLVVADLKKINPITDPVKHALCKKEMQDIEILMSSFKLEHGRKSIPPVVNNAEALARANASKASSAASSS